MASRFAEITSIILYYLDFYLLFREVAPFLADYWHCKGSLPVIPGSVCSSHSLEFKDRGREEVNIADQNKVALITEALPESEEKRPFCWVRKVPGWLSLIANLNRDNAQPKRQTNGTR